MFRSSTRRVRDSIRERDDRPPRPVYAGREAQRGARMRSTGCLGGTSPSGRFGRNVAQGSFSSSAQRRFLWK